MVLLAGLVTYWNKYFGDTRVRKCHRTGCSDKLRRPRDTSLNSIVLKTGSKKFPLQERYGLNTSGVKISAQDVSTASLEARIEDLERVIKSQHDEINGKMADLATTIVMIRKDGEKDGKAKYINN